MDGVRRGGRFWLGDWSLSVRHHLRTSLTAIRCRAQLARRVAASAAIPERDQLVEDLEAIDAAVEEMSEQIDELVRADRVAGRMALPPPAAPWTAPSP